MKHYKIFWLFFLLITAYNASAQETLPDLTVKNFNGKIIVSWQNAYTKPVSNILIQRSYDSLKNYTTIGSVLNPQNKENGYADANPPYNKMYYRVSVSFEGGSYVITKPVRPVKEIPVEIVDSTSQQANQPKYDPRYPWQINSYPDSISAPIPKKDEITYPSQRIFTGRDNNLVIHLPDAAIKKYTAKFFDDADNFLFEVTRLNDEYLIIEKVNFGHAGWFRFEIYEGGKLIEKNKFLILKDGKNGNPDLNKKSGNK